MRSRRVPIGIRPAACIALVVAFVLAGGPVAAYEAGSGPVTLSVVPEASGHSLRVDARATSGVQIYEIRAHVCLPARSVRTNFDFGFEGRVCPNVAVGGSDIDPSAAFPNGVSEGRLDGVRVGSGSAHWVNELGFPGFIRCDAGHPCDLVVRVQITNSTVFMTVPLCGSRPCHAPSSRSRRFVGAVWPWLLTFGGLLAVVSIARARRRRAQVGAS